MRKAPVPKPLKVALAAAFAIAALGAPAANASICAGVNGYCYSTLFNTDTRALGPTLYFRMGDAAGAQTMQGDYSTFGGPSVPLPSGEYKNRQDSGPIGISADGDTARTFFGENGYGYVNGVNEPNWNGSFPYGNFTLESWVYLTPGTTDGGILEWGRQASVFLSGGKFYFQVGSGAASGSSAEGAITPGISTGAITSPGKWFMVVATRDNGQDMTLYVIDSPSSPFGSFASALTSFNTSVQKATATSSYRSGGQSTFYVGLNNQTGAPWFNGSMDEVTLFQKALTVNDLATQYYDDPAPDPATMIRTIPSFTDDSSVPAGDPPGTIVKTPIGSQKPPALTKAQKIHNAKVRVASLTYSLKRAQLELSNLRVKRAPKKIVAEAKKAIADIQHRLAAAKQTLKRLQAKPKPKRPAIKKRA